MGRGETVQQTKVLMAGALDMYRWGTCTGKLRSPSVHPPLLHVQEVGRVPTD